MKTNRGFTLIELMIAVAIIGILSSIALPSYTAYVLRAKVPAGLDALSAYQARMEQTFQDTGSYTKSATECAQTIPTEVANYTLKCEPGDAGQSFVATVTGTGQLVGYSYSVDSAGVRLTVQHPGGVPTANCWSIRGGTCDS